MPLHRIEHWEVAEGTTPYFADAWLEEVGIVIHLGHLGKKCPLTPDFRFAQNGNDPEVEWEDVSDDGLEDTIGPDSEGLYQTRAKMMRDDGADTFITVVDTSGVHRVGFKWCACPNRPEDDMQLFDMGFLPSTFRQVKTVFTFRVLDDFLMENQECHTSANNFFNKLRRITCSAFPHTVLVSNLHF